MAKVVYMKDRDGRISCMVLITDRLGDQTTQLMNIDDIQDILGEMKRKEMYDNWKGG
jgi:hypothetical protein